MTCARPGCDQPTKQKRGRWRKYCSRACGSTANHHPPELRERAVQMIRDGATYRTVVAALHVAHQTLSDWCRAAGVPATREPGGSRPRQATPEQLEACRRLLQEGVLLRDAAKQSGCTTRVSETLLREMKAAGLLPKRRVAVPVDPAIRSAIAGGCARAATVRAERASRHRAQKLARQVRARDLYARGATDDQICEALSVTPKALASWRREGALPRRTIRRWRRREIARRARDPQGAYWLARDRREAA